MEKRVMIVENASESLKKNESASHDTKFILGGKFTEFDIENRNKRMYTAENFIPHMNLLLEKKKKLGVIYGEYDHPDVFDITCKNLSHAIESMVYNEKNNCVDGSISLLSNHWGKEARAIINDGFPLFVSSRAAGVTDSYGRVSLKELFTYDIVADPGFASARVTPKILNESLGYKADEDVPYRIYEMNDTGAQGLFTDNKNDQKTKMDLTMMENFLKNEVAKIEHQLLAKINEGKYSPEEVKKLSEQLEAVMTELTAVKEYLKFVEPKINHLISENSKHVGQIKEMATEISENVGFTNHLASKLKSLNKYAIGIEERLNVSEKFTEHTAEHTKANIMFSEDIAKELTSVTAMLEYVASHVKDNKEFLEYVASETELTQKFAESIAAETEITQKFAENTASETKDTQDFLNYVANEKYKDEVFLNYIAEKVDGLVGYNSKLVSKLKASTPIKENNEDGIHTLETPEEYLGLDDEQAAVNNMEDNGVAATTAVTETPAENAGETAPVENTTATDSPTTDIENEEDNKDSLVNTFVKITGSDDTGVIVSLSPEGNVTVQKTGSDETLELPIEKIEVINTEENIAENVSKLIAEVKKQKVLANNKPHFFNFLTEKEIADFKTLSEDKQEAIILALNESEYFTKDEILVKISQVLNEKSMNYEERLISNIPAEIKEHWNSLPKNQKVSLINESKYFNLITSYDIANFWQTRPFAKATLSPDATLINESLKNDENLSEDYINAFLKKMNVK